ncbi:MAG: HEAT repeat domain-containing protein [Kofleriaceae bacterium]
MSAPMLPRLLVILATLTACASNAKQSISLYEAGKYEAAAKAADDGLADHPDDAALWGMRVRSAVALGKPEDIAHAYGAYMAKRGGDDRELLHDLSTATLAQALASPSTILKLRAIATIEELEISDLAEDVGQAMNDEDERVQAAASVAVIHGFAQAAHVAADMLHADNAEARRIALEGVAKKIGKIALPDIEKGATDRDPRVRAVAVRWLGHYKDADAVTVCTKRLHDPDENVRAAAATALAQIGLGDIAAVAKRALADKALVVRLAGVGVLQSSKAQADYDTLVALADDPDALVALEAGLAVQQAHPELAAKAVQRALASTEWTVRAGAVNSLARALAKPEAIAAAKTATTDPELAVRLAAARVLAHAGDVAGATAVFAAALTDVDAAADLGALGDPRGTAALDALASDPKRTPEQRAAAISAHRTARHVTPTLVGALADPSGLVRVEAAATLAALAK